MDIFNIWDHGQALAKFRDLHTRIKVLAATDATEPVNQDLTKETITSLGDLIGACRHIGLDAVAELIEFTHYQIDEISEGSRALNYSELLHRLMQLNFCSIPKPLGKYFLG